MELNIISRQANSVEVSLKGFLINLTETVAIVADVLLLLMGFRSGLILGVVLMVTIMGIFIFMQMKHITLERISLGELIIALGMLVDCVIVVTDGMRMLMARGKSGYDAAIEIVGQTAHADAGRNDCCHRCFCRDWDFARFHRRILPHPVQRYFIFINAELVYRCNVYPAVMYNLSQSHPQCGGWC